MNHDCKNILLLYQTKRSCAHSVSSDHIITAIFEAVIEIFAFASDGVTWWQPRWWTLPDW